MSNSSGGQRDEWAESYGLKMFVRDTAAIVGIELIKLRRDPSEILMRSVQPALWLLVFGQIFGRLHAVPTGNLDYFTFLAPGILAQSVLFISIFFGISAIWERDLGILQKLLASPAPRTALVLGKALSAGLRSMAQALIIYLLTMFMHVPLNWSPTALIIVAVSIVLGAALFSTFSLLVACIVKTRERFMGIGQVITMPLFFASNAIYPIAIMPGWLKTIAHLNPLTYQVDVLRAMMVLGGTSTFGIGQDLLIQTVILSGLVLVTSRLYPSIIR